MNKKVRILALALAVAVALVGAGYAAWGTEITSTTKMNSGEWKIVLENDSDASYWAGDQIGEFERDGDVLTGTINDANTAWGSLDRDYDAAPSGSGGYITGDDYVYVMAPVPYIPFGIPQSAAANATACTFQFYNMHPGTRAFTRFEVRNDGSIPAKIGDVKVTLLDVWGNALDVNDVAENEVVAAMKVNPVFGIHHNTNGTTSLIDDVTCTLAELEGILDNALIGEMLACDSTLYSYTSGSDELEMGPDDLLANSFNFELPASALEGNIGMMANFQIVVQIDFVQYNQVVEMAY